MKFGRRTFLALASGLLVPEPARVRAYSFLPGPQLWAKVFLNGELVAAVTEDDDFETGIVLPGPGLISLRPGPSFDARSLTFFMAQRGACQRPRPVEPGLVV